MAEELANNDKTPKKRPAKPFRGAIDGVPFTSENQPTPEQKKKGWEELRKARLLTQTILSHFLGSNLDDNQKLEDYVVSLVKLAKEGNAKAIEAINKALEDDIQKIELSGKLQTMHITYIQQPGNEPIKES